MHKHGKIFILVWIDIFFCVHIYLKAKHFDQFSDRPMFAFFSDQSKDQDTNEKIQTSLTLLTKTELENSIAQHHFTILSFWETWCLPCQEEMPRLQQIDRSHPEVQVIGVYRSSKDKDVQRFVDKHAIDILLFKDQQQELMKKHHLEQYPTLVLLNQAGEEIYRKSGFRINSDGSDSLQELRQRISIPKSETE